MMVMEKDWVAVPWALSVTVTLKVAGEAAVVGVPLIKPAELRVSPGGGVPVKVYPLPEPPEAASWSE